MDESLLLMLLADGRLPVGGHTQSSGLEPALLGGLAPGEIRGLIRTRLETVVRVDAGTAVVARAYCLAGRGLRPVDSAWAARTPGAAARAASRQLGRGVVRLQRRIWPDPGVAGLLSGVPAPSRPVAMGALAAASGLSAPAVARLICYDDVQSLCAAALKLVPGDPLDGVAWLRDAAADIDAVVQCVAGLDAPEQIPAASAPLLEIWLEQHAQRERRLFSA